MKAARKENRFADDSWRYMETVRPDPETLLLAALEVAGGDLDDDAKAKAITGLASPGAAGADDGFDAFCGGPGSGVFGPCPTVVHEDAAKGDQPAHVDVSDRARASFDAAPGLTDAQREAHADAVESVTAYMPGKAVGRVAAHVRMFHAYPNAGSLYEGVKDTLPAHVRDAVESGQADVGGGFLDGALHAGDPVPMETSEELGGTVTSIHHLYAHELTHAIDGPNFELSKNMEWAKVWAGEIVGIHDAKGTPDRLSAYAKQSPTEGFAEFGRQVYTRDAAGRANLEKQFPRCTAHWKGLGIWPD